MKKKKAKKSGSKSKKSGKKMSAAARSAAGKKAARTRKRNAAARSAAAKKGARKAKAKKSHSRKASAAPRKKSHKKKKSGSRKKHRKSSRKAPRKTSQTTRSTQLTLPGHTTKLVVVPVPSMSRRGSSKRKTTKRKSSKKRKSGKSKKSSRARESGYAMENPLNGTELFVGGLTLLTGFLIADLSDRFWATHKLTDKNAKDAGGNELYADAPPTTGNYPGLFNSTAILAPYDWKRWANGAAGTVIPFAIAAFVKAPGARSAFQFFGFGFGARFLGKALIDLVAMATKKTSIGQQMYDAEMRAASMKAGANGYPLSSLPSTGLGRPGCNCQNCATGMGACCSYAQPQPGANPAPPPPVPQTPQSQVPGLNATANPMLPQQPPIGSNMAPSTNATGAGAPVKKNPFNWGYDDAAE